MFNRYWLLLFTVFSFECAFGSMTIQVTDLPQLTPILDTLYLAGTVNNWDENSSSHILTNSNGVWSVEIDGTNGSVIEFKITRGTWARVEGSISGGYIPNRTVVYQNGGVIQITIAGWEDFDGTTTVTPHVRVLDSNYYMPQLNRARRIWVVLPTDYYETSISYPVLYLQDGQNLFNAGTSFSGEWSVDESIINEVASPCAKMIIIGIDNGGENRLNEYAPWVNNQYNAGGQGDEYAAFIVETLKPFIDSYFRTLPDRLNTGIGGSSLGALISAYVLFTYPDVFSKAALFSSAYWFNPEIYNLAENHVVFPDTRIYHVCGTNEGNGSVLEDQNDMMNSLNQVGYDPGQLEDIDWVDGQHSEWFWEREFPAAADWLFVCLSKTGNISHSICRVYPNPAEDFLVVESQNDIPIDSIQIFNLEGKMVSNQMTNTGRSAQVSLHGLLSGTYTIKAKLRGEFYFESTFLKK